MSTWQGMQFLPKKFSFGFGFGGEESFKSKKAGELEFFGAFMEEISFHVHFRKPGVRGWTFLWKNFSFMSNFASLTWVIGHFCDEKYLSGPFFREIAGFLDLFYQFLLFRSHWAREKQAIWTFSPENSSFKSICSGKVDLSIKPFIFLF